MTESRYARRRRQARVRHRGEQYVADRCRSNPTVHDLPHTGRSA
ncbi:hypothetical protein [Streptomyces aureocirculatus]|nr:hypothetical protein [Streptomyces aureocirculatus]